MKITVCNVRGSTGKTPIATNELYHVLGDIFSEERVLQINPDEEFPELPSDIDIVFDLGVPGR